ncbi:MAG: LysR family transcriptional regulator [Myxococcales bacterium]|nr:LysR family transcriptional regulator [Myxococcales bacterium]
MLSDDELALLTLLHNHCNLRRASRALGRPLATLSRQLVALEARLGHPIYLRNGRALVATRPGQVLLERASRATHAREEVEAAVRSFAGGGPESLVVATSPLFAELVLADALASFAAKRPNVSVDVHLGHDIRALHEGRIDLALRRGPLADTSSLRARKLGRTTMVCVAAADDGVDLAVPPAARVAPLRWVRVASSRAPLEIRFADGRRRASVVVPPRITVDSQRVALTLVRGGGFAARLNEFFVREGIARGELVEILPEGRTTEDVYAVFPDRRSPDPLVRELVVAIEHNTLHREVVGEPNARGGAVRKRRTTCRACCSRRSMVEAFDGPS